MRDQSKIRGCLLGGAVGDAFGYPVSALRMEQIREKYGRSGLLGYDLCNGYAEISANTQMSLFTANGLLLGRTRGCMRGVMGPFAGYLAIAYLDWIKTQRLMHPDPAHKSYCWLYHVPQLRHRRGANVTTVRVLCDRTIGTMEQPVSRCRDCGALGRIAPIAAYLDPAATPQAEIDRLGAEAAAITHGHPIAFLSAAVLTHLLSGILYAGAGVGDWRALIEGSCAAVREAFPAFPADSLWQTMQRTLTLARSAYPDADAIAQLGDGEQAETALGVALLCAIRHSDDLESAVIAAINHDGNSAATGALCGSILGAMFGEGAIAPYNLEPLELFDVIDAVANDLYADCRMNQNSNFYDESWVAKYLEGRYEPAE